MPLRILTLSFLGIMLVSCATPEEGFVMPLDNAASRPALLYFGLRVTPDPAQNPIDPPERFSGYHAALDFEVLPDEEDKDVAVYAICDGRILSSQWAEGYGGVTVQSCTLNGKPITVLYGHLKTDSLLPARTRLKRGQQIAILAQGRTRDSDNNRKHLHLGIHRGKGIDMRGYVQSPDELKAYIDPASVLGLPVHPWPSEASESSVSGEDIR